MAPASNAHPSASPTQAFISIQTTATPFTVIPANIIFSISVTNSTISTANTSLWLNVSDATTSTLCVTNDISGLVVDTSASTAYYVVALAASSFTNYSKACPSFLSDGDSFTIAVIQNGLANGVAVATSTPFLTSFILVAPTSLLHVGPTASTTTYAISANYTAQYSGRVELQIYNTAGTTVIFSANLARNGTSTTTVTWTEAAPGSYPYTLTLFTAYYTTGFNTTGSINVLPVTIVHNNATTWENSTFIPGLTAGAAGTILLVVGLIVGMIVALLVGRMVWGGQKGVAPAQPWTGKTEGANANVCSTCGRSFATPEELSEHAKTEHGMQ